VPLQLESQIWRDRGRYQTAGDDNFHGFIVVGWLALRGFDAIMPEC